MPLAQAPVALGPEIGAGLRQREVDVEEDGLQAHSGMITR
jgi:hypothetical protein